MDVLQPVLLGAHLEGYELLIVDEFLTFNGVSEVRINSQRASLEEHLDALQERLGISTPRRRASEFMRGEEYGALFEETRERIESEHLGGALRATVPERHRDSPGAELYPFHEIACVTYLASRGFATKLGPSRERAYDRIMERLRIPMRFGYLTDTFALATPTEEAVVHYSPNDRGSGQRLFFDDRPAVVKQKLAMSNDAAVRKLGQLAAEAARIQGVDDPRIDRIGALYGKHLRRDVRGLLADYVGVGV